MQTTPAIAALIATLTLALTLSTATHAQSFDCHKAETDPEWAICNTPELGRMDGELAETYRRLATAVATTPKLAATLEDTQASWIHGQRAQCGGSADCLAKAYRERLAALEELARTSRPQQ